MIETLDTHDTQILRNSISQIEDDLHKTPGNLVVNTLQSFRACRPCHIPPIVISGRRQRLYRIRPTAIVRENATFTKAGHASLHGRGAIGIAHQDDIAAFTFRRCSVITHVVDAHEVILTALWKKGMMQRRAGRRGASALESGNDCLVGLLLLRSELNKCKENS